jgi:hypothetical protein
MRDAHVGKDDPSVMAHLIILDGQVVGGWKRTLEKSKVIVELNPLTPLTKPEKKAVAAAADRFGKFLELKVELKWNKQLLPG